MRPSRLKRFLRMDDFDLHLELHRLDCLGSHRLLDHHTFCREAQLVALGRRPSAPRRSSPAATSSSQASVPPLFKTILDEVETLQLEDRLTTREAALEHVRRRYRSASH